MLATLSGHEVSHTCTAGPPMTAMLPGLVMLATLSGHEVDRAVGPLMLATLPGLTMLATLSGHEVGHAVGPLLAWQPRLPMRWRWVLVPLLPP